VVLEVEGRPLVEELLRPDRGHLLLDLTCEVDQLAGTGTFDVERERLLARETHDGLGQVGGRKRGVAPQAGGGGLVGAAEHERAHERGRREKE
jgi:hypothetical protein